MPEPVAEPTFYLLPFFFSFLNFICFGALAEPVPVCESVGSSGAGVGSCELPLGTGD